VCWMARRVSAACRAGARPLKLYDRRRGGPGFMSPAVGSHCLELVLRELVDKIAADEPAPLRDLRCIDDAGDAPEDRQARRILQLDLEQVSGRQLLLGEDRHTRRRDVVDPGPAVNGGLLDLGINDMPSSREAVPGALVPFLRADALRPERLKFGVA